MDTLAGGFVWKQVSSNLLERQGAMMRPINAWVAVVVLLGWCCPAPAADWGQFRGPNGNGLSDEPSLPLVWDAEKNVRWQVSVPGEAWSAPVVAGGKVILTTAVSEGSKSPNSVHRWQVICLDENSGEVLWTKVAKTAKPTIRTHRDNTYASETPVTDGQYVVAYFGMTGLYCFDLDGNEVWSKDLGTYKMQADWGTSSSPVIIDGSVILQVDNEEASFIVSMDLATGTEQWRKQRAERSNWGTPLVWRNAKRTELITAGTKIRSYDPSNGELLWELNFGRSGINSSPAGDDDLLIVGHVGRDGGGMFAVRAGASGDISLRDGQTSNDFVAWSSNSDGPGRSSPLLYQGYVYLLGKRDGVVTCLDAQTGKTAYVTRLPRGGAFWASPWAHDGKVFCPDENGNTFVIEAGPEYKLVATNRLPTGGGDRYWATAAIANGTLFIRSTSKLFAIQEP